MTGMTQTKRVIFNVKRSDIDDERFLSHWLTTHAPLVTAAPNYSKYVTRYQQAIPVRGFTLSESAWPAEFISISEFWPHKSANSEPPFSTSRYFIERIDPDVDLFVDRDRSVQAFVDEEILVETSGCYRMIFVLRAKSGMARTEFIDHMNASFSLMQKRPTMWSAVTGYVRSFTQPGRLTSYSGTETIEFRFDAIEEFYFQAPSCAIAAFESEAYREEIKLAAAEFLDGGHSCSLLVRDVLAYS